MTASSFREAPITRDPRVPPTLSYTATSPGALAQAALDTLGAVTGGYRTPEPGAAHRAARLIAELL